MTLRDCIEEALRRKHPGITPTRVRDILKQLNLMRPTAKSELAKNVPASQTGMCISWWKDFFNKPADEIDRIVKESAHHHKKRFHYH